MSRNIARSREQKSHRAYLRIVEGWDGVKGRGGECLGGSPYSQHVSNVRPPTGSPAPALLRRPRWFASSSGGISGPEFGSFQASIHRSYYPPGRPAGRDGGGRLARGHGWRRVVVVPISPNEKELCKDAFFAGRLLQFR